MSTKLDNNLDELRTQAGVLRASILRQETELEAIELKIKSALFDTWFGVVETVSLEDWCRT